MLEGSGLKFISFGLGGFSGFGLSFENLALNP